MTRMEIQTEIKDVIIQPGNSRATVPTASKTKAPDHANSKGRARRNTLQNRKKWASTKPTTKPPHQVMKPSASAPIVPTTSIKTSVKDSRKPGAKFACCIG